MNQNNVINDFTLMRPANNNRKEVNIEAKSFLG